MNSKEQIVSKEWLEGLVAIANQVQNQIEELDFKTRTALLGGTNTHILIGYALSAYPLVKKDKNAKS